MIRHIVCTLNFLGSGSCRVAAVCGLAAALLVSEGCIHTTRVPPHYPPTATCAAVPNAIHAETGEVATIRADAISPKGRPLKYSWTATGGTVDGTGPEVRWAPGPSAPGTYTVSAEVDDGTGPPVTCSADVRLEPRPNRPPSLQCSASSSLVPAGVPVQITAAAIDPDNDPLTFSWEPSGGQVSGSGAEVVFNTGGLPPGSYTVRGRVDDGRGGAADCSVEITVVYPPPVKELEVRLSLPSIYFPPAQPTAANPRGGLIASQQQRLRIVADDFKKYLEYKPDAHLLLRGYASDPGTRSQTQVLSLRRADSVKAFLVAQGVPADHIDTIGLVGEFLLTAAEVKEMIEQEPQLTNPEKAGATKALSLLVPAYNRRVDLVLSTTGQSSTRRFPYSDANELGLGLQQKDIPGQPLQQATSYKPNCSILAFSFPPSLKVEEEPAKAYVLMAMTPQDLTGAMTNACDAPNPCPQPSISELCSQGYTENNWGRFWRVVVTDIVRPELRLDKIDITEKPPVAEQGPISNFAVWRWTLKPNPSVTKDTKVKASLELFSGPQLPVHSPYLPPQRREMLSQEVQLSALTRAQKVQQGIQDVGKSFWQTTQGKIFEGIMAFLGAVLAGFIKKKWPKFFPAEAAENKKDMKKQKAMKKDHG